MKPIVELIAESEGLSDELVHMFIYELRANHLFIGFLHNLTNTANEQIRALENINLTTEEGVRIAIASQGYCKGIRTLIQTVSSWDDDVREKVMLEQVQQKEKSDE